MRFFRKLVVAAGVGASYSGLTYLSYQAHKKYEGTKHEFIPGIGIFYHEPPLLRKKRAKIAQSQCTSPEPLNHKT